MIEFKFLLYQLFRSVADCEGYDGYGELGLDSGEGALETATTSKEGSRRVIYPISTLLEVVTTNRNGHGIILEINLNEYNVKNLTRINWRASLVPAATVIPAPIAYIIVVAVRKFVVGF